MNTQNTACNMENKGGGSNHSSRIKHLSQSLGKAGSWWCMWEGKSSLILLTYSKWEGKSMLKWSGWLSVFKGFPPLLVPYIFLSSPSLKKIPTLNQGCQTQAQALHASPAGQPQACFSEGRKSHQMLCDDNMMTWVWYPCIRWKQS